MAYKQKLLHSERGQDALKTAAGDAIPRSNESILRLISATAIAKYQLLRVVKASDPCRQSLDVMK
jgi:hypothetical protein